MTLKGVTLKGPSSMDPLCVRGVPPEFVNFSNRPCRCPTKVPMASTPPPPFMLKLCAFFKQ
jgi:hypothetical protein